MRKPSVFVVLFLIISPALAQDYHCFGPPVFPAHCQGKKKSNHTRKWHRATKKECDLEYKRELKAMNDAGWRGDPSISLGWSMFNLGADEGSSMEPCGYTDGEHFKPRYLIYEKGKEREVGEEEYRHWNCTRPGVTCLQ